jgi:NAD-dependent dihydropyrimidine dehydrogenase PreA subunit
MTPPRAAKANKRKPSKVAVINGELCGLCEGCSTVCPANAVEVLETFVVVVPDTCTGCGTCLKVCPVGAISLVER